MTTEPTTSTAPDGVETDRSAVQHPNPLHPSPLHPVADAAHPAPHHPAPHHPAPQHGAAHHAGAPLVAVPPLTAGPVRADPADAPVPAGADQERTTQLAPVVDPLLLFAAPQAPRGPAATTGAVRLDGDPAAPDAAVQIPPRPAASLSAIEARSVSAWFGSHQVLERVSLTMAPGQVTALIGPSGCGKSTFLRILNRMHELVPSAALAGEVLLDGDDIYDRRHKIQDARKDIGMVFQRPNPFPAMSIFDNVLAGLRLTGRKASRSEKDEIVATSLTRAGLWTEVKDRLRQPGGGLSGGQQQRLCIARSLAVRPKVLLMDEPCSALDPTSTRVIEETMGELQKEVTIVIVTHNMQQAQRVSQQCAFFLASQGTPGAIVEHGDTDAMFSEPQDPRTYDYVNGRFG
jgi:phosphate transport system ATP-binding protein